MTGYHRPVLLDESIEGLKINPSGVFVDATFGGGGHARAILDRLDDNGHLFAFDQDEDARQNAVSDKRCTFVLSNFRFLKQYITYYDVEHIDGVIADLGVSSWQFDNPERGFSFREDQAMDMRMTMDGSLTAADILHSYPEKELVRIFSHYGEVRNAKTLARRIVDQRQPGIYDTVSGFLEVIGSCIRGHRPRYLAQVFQALRIEVNDEIGALEDLLSAATDVLAPGGRLVVISYHSIEDRRVKKWMRTGNHQGELIKDDFGNVISPLKSITKKPVVPDKEEIEINYRARSAKLRIAEKQ